MIGILFITFVRKQIKWKVLKLLFQPQPFLNIKQFQIGFNMFAQYIIIQIYILFHWEF